jgi:hypothetical protein
VLADVNSLVHHSQVPAHLSPASQRTQLRRISAQFMDPSDGLLHSVKQGVAKLLLCALPSSGRAPLKQKRTSWKNLAVEGTQNGEEPGLGDETEMSKFKADQVRQAVCKHCFRIPGTSFSSSALSSDRLYHVHDREVLR